MPVNNELLPATCAHLFLCGMLTERQRRWLTAAGLNHSLATSQAACMLP